MNAMFDMRTRPSRVLIVDDEVIQRLILGRCVELLGWTVDTAACLDEAAAKLAAYSYDAVIIDLRLGEQDGIHLLKMLKGNRADPLIIFVSGMDNRTRSAALRVARDQGLRVAGTLSKPINPDSLQTLLLADPARLRTDAPPPGNGHPSAEELREALYSDEIYTEYQAKTDLATGMIVGVEALARWRSPLHGLVSPTQFVLLAEQSDLIDKLTFRVMNDAIVTCRQWRELLPNFSVSVNISPYMLSDPTLLTVLDTLLSRHDLPPEALVAEVTESAMIANLALATEVLTRLSIKGVRVSMDDFGTGYSSLLSLLRMPFTELKIDRSFVSVCQTDPEAWKIVRATVSLSSELGMRVVAEGVETVDLNNRLRDIGCDVGQGWFIGRPMPAAAMQRRLDLEVARPEAPRPILMPNELVMASHGPIKLSD
jgi:EAL domain-containing protein (putative c-di-GMP-specific phosphodiesterase class I)/ActR/RegA family two-component response regulator